VCCVASYASVGGAETAYFGPYTVITTMILCYYGQAGMFTLWWVWLFYNADNYRTTQLERKEL